MNGCDVSARLAAIKDIPTQRLIELAVAEAAGLISILPSAAERAHPDAQPNEPLTEAELRCMVGDWVWVTVQCYHYYNTSGWAVICTGTQLDFMGQMLDISDCGVKFTAYRRPPKEDAK